MIDRTAPHRPGLLLLAALALTMLPPAAQSQQQLAFAGCVSSDANMGKVLNAPAALGTGIHVELQNFTTCFNFCRFKTVPTGRYVEFRGDRGAFTPPYTFMAFTGGGWCFCGNQINAQLISLDNCRQQIACLSDPGAKCNDTEADQMIFAPGSGATVTGGGQQTPPPPPAANRRPNAPVVQPGGFEPPIPLRYEGAVQLTWQDNGDPDGDPLAFGVFIWYLDTARGQWVQLPTLRDYLGVDGRVWVNEPYYTFTTQAGLRPDTAYSWMVFACDVSRGNQTLCSWSGWSQFRTVP